MYASRVLRTAATAAHKGFLVPPRTQWDSLSSAGNACASLFFNQDNRNDFMKLVNNGIISVPVLGQANLGWVLMLALYNDLKTPEMKKYGFEAQEFLDGVKPALEQFYLVSNSMRNTLAAVEQETAVEEETAVEDDNADISFGSEEAEKEAAKLMLMTGISKDDKTLRKLVKCNWKEEAEKDSESMAARLRAMLTPEWFDMVEFGIKGTYIMDKSLVYHEGSSSVMNVALLSARAVVLDNDAEEDDNEESEDVKENELNLKDAPEAEVSTNKPAVVAQVEVLYDVEETFTRNKPQIMTAEGESTEEKEPETEQFTAVSVHVGIFEGWLNGDPSGNQELQWRFAADMPPWEFPDLARTVLK